MFGLGRRDLGQRSEQLAELLAVLVEIASEVDSSGCVEEREGQVRLEDAVRRLGAVDGDGEAARFPGRIRPFGIGYSLAGGECLTADDQSKVELPAHHRVGRVGHQGERHRAADPRITAVSRVGAEAFGQAEAGVVVLPRLAVDDLEALEFAERASDARVGGRGSGDLLPHVERLGRGLVPPGVPCRRRRCRRRSGRPAPQESRD